MRNSFLVLAMGCFIPCFGTVTYSYTGAYYATNSITNYTSCTTGDGTCAELTSSMHITGTITTNAALGANLSISDISSSAVSWSFNDGLDTISSTDSTMRVHWIAASTDSSGNITTIYVEVDKWVTSGDSHAYGDRMHRIWIDIDYDMAYHNMKCNSVPDAGDMCSGMSHDTSSSYGETTAAGTWAVSSSATTTATATPALSEWMMLVLVMLMAYCGWRLAGRATA